MPNKTRNKEGRDADIQAQRKPKKSKRVPKESQTSSQSDNPQNSPIIVAAKIALIGTIITACITASVALINKFAPPLPEGPVITPTAIGTITLEPSFSPTLTENPPPLAFTPHTCPFPGQTDDETIKNLIREEAIAVNSEDLDIILKIFSPDAEFYDYAQKDPKTHTEPRKWDGPRERYQYDLFQNTELQGVQHLKITPVEPGIDGNVAYYVSGSMGSYRSSSDQWTPFNNPSIPDEPYGSDHWVLQKDNNGCWVIVRMEFNAGYKAFPP